MVFHFQFALEPPRYMDLSTEAVIALVAILIAYVPGLSFLDRHRNSSFTGGVEYIVRHPFFLYLAFLLHNWTIGLFIPVHNLY